MLRYLRGVFYPSKKAAPTQTFNVFSNQNENQIEKEPV